MLGRLIGEQIIIHWDLTPGLPPVLADLGCLEQVMMNLVVNACDAMSNEGELRITTSEQCVDIHTLPAGSGRKPGHYVCVGVQDTGHGIKPEVLSRIFEPFFTTKEVGKGTGLGLATVYGILKQHGGWIDVDSEVGKGTHFHFCLPIVPRQREAGCPCIPASPSAVNGERRTILLVEDESAVREMVAEILGQQDYVIRTAASGVEALKVWDEHGGRFDLLLTDVVMPEGISGLALADTLLSHYPNLPVIYMSGYSLNLANEGLAARKGAAFLQKPFGPEELRRAISECHDARRSEALWQ
jgi:CheY-like chemotaxis protein